MADGLALRKICEMPGMPSRRSIFYWLKENEEFSREYEIARLMQVEYWAHEIVDIADDAEGDCVLDERGQRVVDHENISRARLRVDTRKWLMSKLLPKRYGDRIEAQLEVTQRADDRRLAEILSQLSPGERAAVRASMELLQQRLAPPVNEGVN